MSAGVVHIIGAGIAGLSAAVRLVDAGRKVIVHEAAAFAGGRCRSYLDPTLGVVIDNGNHLLLSGNHEALDYLDRIGARKTLHDPGAAVFDFADLKSGERWRLDLSEGRIPWWLFDRKKRVPGTAFGEYFAPLGVFMKGRKRDSRRGDGLRGAALRAALAPPADLGAQYRSSGKLRRAHRGFAARDSRRWGKGVPPAVRRPRACEQFHRSGARLSRRDEDLRSGSATGSRRSVSRGNAPSRSTLTGRRRNLSADDSVILSDAAMDREGPPSRPDDARRISRHSQRPFPDRAASRPTGDPRRRQR